MEFPEENDEAPIVPKRGKILCRLGAGSYGTVYKLLNTDTGEIRALKTGFVRDIKRIQLKTEHEVYEAVGNRFGFVKCYNAIFGTKVSSIELDYMGPSVHGIAALRRTFGFNEKTVLMLAYQMINALESLKHRVQIF
ncbi:hypothetical protein ACOME3_006748 [Neoechinorhynchus agilis]